MSDLYTWYLWEIHVSSGYLHCIFSCFRCKKLYIPLNTSPSGTSFGSAWLQTIINDLAPQNYFSTKSCLRSTPWSCLLLTLSYTTQRSVSSLSGIDFAVSFLIYCSIFFFSFLVFSSLLLASSPLDHWFPWCLHLLSCVILVGTAYVYYFFYWSQEAWQYWWWLANLINIISSSPPIQCNISYHQPVKYILTSVNHPRNTLRSAMEYKPYIFLLFNSQQEHWQLCWRNAAAPVPSGQHLGWD